MTQRRVENELPPDAARYLTRMRGLQRPIDLVENVMAEVDATPQVRVGWGELPVFATVAAAVAAALLAVALLFRFWPPTVGPTPSPTPVPLDQLPSAGEVRSRISTDASDVPAAFAHGFLWLTNAATGELIRLDPETASIASPLRVSEGGAADLPVAVDDASVWVFDNAGREIVQIHQDSMAELRRIPVGVTARAMALGGGALWVANAAGGEVLRMDQATGDVQLHVPIAAPGALLLDGDAVWVGSGPGELIRLDPASGDVIERIQTFATATYLARLGDGILLGGAFGTVMRVDLASGTIAARGPTARSLAVRDGRVWATLFSGHLVELDASSLEPITALNLELDDMTGMVAGGDDLWIIGSNAAGDGSLVQVTPRP